MQALEAWSRGGVPEDPAGWLHRPARNLAIDALRGERPRAQALPRLAEDAERESSPLEAHFADEIGDEPLRLLFVCCHEAVPAESRVAIALRMLCGFSTAEIARALLTTDINVQKRIARARDRLRELGEQDMDFGSASIWEGEAPAEPGATARQEPRPPQLTRYLGFYTPAAGPPSAPPAAGLAVVHLPFSHGLPVTPRRMPHP